MDRPTDYLVGLVVELCKLPRETGWLEFKIDEHEPQEIGEYISALANSAALDGKASAYLVWGVADTDHHIVGTHFKPWTQKVGNEELENWLLRLLEPKLFFRFFDVTIEGHSVVLLEINRASGHPVRFSGQEFVRVGSYKKKLTGLPELERRLWRVLDATPFEDGIAGARFRGEDVLRLLDYPAYFDLVKQSLPESRDGVLNALDGDRLIRLNDAGGWDVTNLGAVLFAKRLEDWPSLRRKAVRVVQYRGNSRVETIREQLGSRGYASGFERLIGFVNGLLPSNEVIEQALRKSVPRFPELAVRELVANALIHQDFLLTGSGPMVEIFEDRIEITNPGRPLVDANRFVDKPPRSRNESLASLMRRIGICEERGSGWDKVVFQTELYQLPAPLAEVPDDHTRVILFAPRPLSAMDKADRVRAVYLHACLRYVNRGYLTNSSVRQRFGIEPQNIATASRLIREGVAAGSIVPQDASAAPKFMRYIPFWASPSASSGT